MAEPSTLIPNLSKIIEEHAQPEGEVHLEPTEEDRVSEQPEVQPVARQQKKKGKERKKEEEEDEFVSEEAFSMWKKHYAGKGFVGKGIQPTHLPFPGIDREKRVGEIM